VIIANFFGRICGDDHPYITRSALSAHRHAAKTLTVRNGRGSELNIVTVPIISAIHQMPCQLASGGIGHAGAIAAGVTECQI
jgi:hypothetical protein